MLFRKLKTLASTSDRVRCCRFGRIFIDGLARAIISLLH